MIKDSADMLTSGPLTVLYDADCGFCSRSASVLRHLDRARALRLVPLQERGESIAGAPAEEELVAEMHVVDGAGRWQRGAAAWLQIAGVVPALRPLSVLGRVPTFGRGIERLYELVAGNRHRLSHLLGFERDGDEQTVTWTVGIGLAAWVAAIAILPAPMAARITLGAPLVLVPHLLTLHPMGRWAHRLGGWPALLAALPLLIAFALPAGPAAAAFSLPWLILCLTIGAGAAWHGLGLLPGLLHPRQAAVLGADLALGFLAGSSLFIVTERLGARPLDFPSVIILLTATHLSFAGFGLLTIACLLAVRRPALRAPILGLAFAIPFTAVAFVLASDTLNVIGATLTGTCGLAVAAVLLTPRGVRQRDGMQRIAGAAMLLGFPMGIAWAWSILLGIGFIDLELMVRTHGVLNASGVLLAAFALRAARE